MSYTRNRWPALQTCLEDGRLEIDRNTSARKIRRFVMGLMPWLSCQTSQGAPTSAVPHSMVRSAKTNGLKSCSYMRGFFATLPAISPQDTDVIKALLPWRVAGRNVQVDQKSAQTALAWSG